MKKIIMLSIVALIAVGFIGCGAEDEKTVADVQWTNTGGGVALHDIKWIGSKGEQTWNAGVDNALPVGSTNEFKGVEDLTGEGQCVDSGLVDYTINIEGDTDGGSYTLTENATETLVIDNIAAK